MKNKDLDDIRPARGGVKIKSRKPKPPKKQPVERPPRVIKDVVPPQGELPLPTEEAVRLVSEANRARTSLMEAMRHLNRDIMSSKILPENRTSEQGQAEKDAVKQLCDTAIALEQVNPGEGLLGMATLAVRQGLLLRDAGNRLAYLLSLMERKVGGVERDVASLKRMFDLRKSAESSDEEG